MLTDNKIVKKVKSINLPKLDKNSTIKQEISDWFAFSILYDQKRDIHYNDCPYDHSGTLHSDGSFCLDDYKLLSDFLEEYNGHTRATYVSGMGLSHETYFSEFEELIETYVNKLVEPLKLSEDVLYSDEFFEKTSEYERLLHDQYHNLTCSELFDLGKNNAEIEYITILKQREDDIIEFNNKIIAAKELIKKYNIDSSIHYEKLTEEWKSLKKILKTLEKEELKLLSLVLKTSNSIKANLSDGSIK